MSEDATHRKHNLASKRDTFFWGGRERTLAEVEASLAGDIKDAQKKAQGFLLEQVCACPANDGLPDVLYLTTVFVSVQKAVADRNLNDSHPVLNEIAARFVQAGLLAGAIEVLDYSQAHGGPAEMVALKAELVYRADPSRLDEAIRTVNHALSRLRGEKDASNPAVLKAARMLYEEKGDKERADKFLRKLQERVMREGGRARGAESEKGTVRQ